MGEAAIRKAASQVPFIYSPLDAKTNFSYAAIEVSAYSMQASTPTSSSKGSLNPDYFNNNFTASWPTAASLYTYKH